MTTTTTFRSMLRQPSAAIPLLMSLAAYLLIFGVLATTGVTQPEDEGRAARLFQLLILLQVPVIAAFAFQWLPRNARSAIWVLLLQAGAAGSAVGFVWFLEARFVS
jgi:hypothetical protein